MAFTLFFVAVALILCGFPVAFALAGAALLFIFMGIATGQLDPSFLQIFSGRLYGIMTNGTLIAVPLFVFMGVTLQRSEIAETLLEHISGLMLRFRGDLGIAVIIVGALLAASTGIVGATVVTLGLMSLPAMLKRGYDPRIACGAVCASGTLGQIIPPSIVLVLLGDVISSAYQTAQLKQGSFSPATVSVIDLFAGALVPGLIMVGLYLIYLIFIAVTRPHMMPAPKKVPDTKPDWKATTQALLAPLFLIIAVLGTILLGAATPTEAASIGATGAIALTALKGHLSIKKLAEIAHSSTRITCMVFMVLIGASIFSLAFRGFGGDDMVHELLTRIPGGTVSIIFVVMVTMFIMGFFLDFIEITLVVVPIVAPVLLMMGLDPIWLGVLIAINLQTSFLTPPFGFSLFYLRGVAPPTVSTRQIYTGAIPFIALQLATLVLLVLWPGLATWLPNTLFGS